MNETPHILDPDGDVLLILKNPNAPFAHDSALGDGFASPGEVSSTNLDDHLVIIPRDMRFLTALQHIQAYQQIQSDQLQFSTLTPATAQKSLSQEPVLSSQAVDSDQPGQNGVEQVVNMRVSSSHLRLASPYFKRMFKNNWKETETLHADGLIHVDMEDWDADALLILMNIIHGHLIKVPRIVALEKLAKLAVLVDYYECDEAAAFFSEMWIGNLKNEIPKTFSRGLVLWIFISWVFHHQSMFERVTEICLWHCKASIDPMGLPIPSSIVESIERQRQNNINLVFAGLETILLGFCREQPLCSFECDSILAGALTKQLYARQLHPRPKPPFSNINFTDIVRQLSEVKSPQWYRERNPYQPHLCTLNTHINSRVDLVKRGIVGLRLGTFDKDKNTQ